MKRLLIQRMSSSLQSINPNVIPEYTITENIRHVKPYFQTINTTIKTRWMNRTILDVLSSEFRSFSEDEYLRRIKRKEITVIHQEKLTKKEKKERKSDCGTTKLLRRIEFPELLDFELQGNDLIERIEHIHERSVFGIKSHDIEVVYEDENVLVMNKPSGIPIHPVQNYFFNSFVKILEVEGWNSNFDNKNTTLRPCYRLDKLTSGVCIFAKSTDVARKIQMEIQNREVEKVYLARVVGEFPEDEVDCNDDIVILDTKKGKDEGVLQKTARTIFKRMCYNATLDESIVMCYPKTGRTHQIRIHLRNLRHPITNDPLYGDGKMMSLIDGYDHTNVDNAYFDKIESIASANRENAESSESCNDCGVTLYEQTPAKDLVMYLHAFKYGLKDKEGWSYQTKYPDWANI